MKNFQTLYLLAVSCTPSQHCYLSMAASTVALKLASPKCCQKTWKWPRVSKIFSNRIRLNLRSLILISDNFVIVFGMRERWHFKFYLQEGLNGNFFFSKICTHTTRAYLLLLSYLYIVKSLVHQHIDCQRDQLRNIYNLT